MDWPTPTCWTIWPTVIGPAVANRWERLGRLHGRWRDVVLLERRSPMIQ